MACFDAQCFSLWLIRQDTMNNSALFDQLGDSATNWLPNAYRTRSGYTSFARASHGPHVKFANHGLTRLFPARFPHFKSSAIGVDTRECGIHKTRSLSLKETLISYTLS